MVDSSHQTPAGARMAKFQSILGPDPDSAEARKARSQALRFESPSASLEREVHQRLLRDAEYQNCLRTLHELQREAAVDEYFRSTPLVEILTRLVNLHGRAAVVRAVKGVPPRRLYENDHWEVWLAVQERLWAMGCKKIDVACRQIARLGGVPRWLPLSTGRERESYATAASIRTAYYRALDWIRADKLRERNAADLRDRRLKAWRASGRPFDAYQRAQLERARRAAGERARKTVR